MKKRCFRMTISLVLAVVLAFSFTANAFAADLTKATDEIDIKNKMTRILASIAHEKEYYGLKDVDLTNVSVGNKIPTYEVVEGKVRDSELDVYPILHNGNMVSYFVVTKDINNEWYVQLENTIVNMTNDVLEADEFAYVYDANGLNIISDKRVTTIFCNDLSYNTQKTESLDINALASLPESELYKINEQAFNVKFTLNISDSLPIASMNGMTADIVNGTRNTPGYLDVTIGKQSSGEKLCWCYAVHAVINFVLQTNIPFNTIWNVFNGGINTTQAMSQVVNNMNVNYNMDYYAYYTSTYSATSAYNQLVAGYPILGGFRRYQDGESFEHMVVIRGVSVSGNTFSIADSNYDDTVSPPYYKSGIISYGGVWSYVNTLNKRYYSIYAVGYHLG